MKHQILSLRPVYNPKKEEWDITDNKHAKRGWGFDDLATVLADSGSVLGQIPADEHWNLFYTVAKCAEKRQFVRQEILMFDIDKMGLDETTPLEKYAPIVANVLGIDPSGLAVICSGNGLHFAFKLKLPITEAVFFDNNRRHYSAICEKIDHALAAAGLKGNADPAVFDPRRIMRLPDTENRKEGKPSRKAYTIYPRMDVFDFSFEQCSGLPNVVAEDHVPPQMLKKIPTDEVEVLRGCDFIKFAKAKPNEISEAQWYAVLSILGRINRKTAHEYSEGHRSYNFAETESKIDQALQASGPRTCKGIDKLWGQCAKCPNFEKVSSPIMLRGADFIKTEHTGFHQMIQTEHGMRAGKPQYDDLRRFFDREAPYKTIGDSGIVVRWDGKVWEEWPEKKLMAYAQKKFDPTADTGMVKEFANLVARTNAVNPKWFTASTYKKMNFANGVLDTQTLEFSAHDSRFGFRYCLPYDYSPDAKAPIFEKFVLEVMDDRAELANLLLEYVGYCLSGDTCWAQKAMLLTGTGANGKSTFMELLQGLAGAGNYSTRTIGELKEGVHRHALNGVLFNVAEETPTHAMVDSTVFKTLVGGGEVTGKQLYSQPYSFANKAKLMFACNDLPTLKDVSRGIFRRFIIIPFERTFNDTDPNYDPFIKDKMLAELPGIVNLVLAHYRELAARRRFIMVDVVTNELHKFRLESDNVLRWFEDCIEVEDLSGKAVNEVVQIKVSSLYGEYRNFCDEEGEKPETKPTFEKRLARLIPNHRCKGTKRGDRERRYAGLKLLKGSTNF